MTTRFISMRVCQIDVPCTLHMTSVAVHADMGGIRVASCMSLAETKRRQI